jgi:hypothetical protein
MLKDMKLSTKNEPIQSCKVYTGQKAVADLIETMRVMSAFSLLTKFSLP